MTAGKFVIPRNARNRDRRTNGMRELVASQSIVEAAYLAELKAIVTERVELRFGPDSDVARMLGLVNS